MYFRKSRKSAIILAGLFLLVLSGCKRSGFEIGNRFPDLDLFDMKSRPVTVYQHVGDEKLLILQLWGAACCPVFSKPTLKAVSAIASDESMGDLTVVSVNLDNPIPEILRISKESGLEQLMLSDKMSNYYAKEERYRLFFPLSIVFLIDDQNIIRGKLTGHQTESAIRSLVIQTKNRKN